MFGHSELFGPNPGPIRANSPAPIWASTELRRKSRLRAKLRQSRLSFSIHHHSDRPALSWSHRTPREHPWTAEGSLRGAVSGVRRVTHRFADDEAVDVGHAAQGLRAQQDAEVRVPRRIWRSEVLVSDLNGPGNRLQLPLPLSCAIVEYIFLRRHDCASNHATPGGSFRRGRDGT